MTQTQIAYMNAMEQAKFNFYSIQEKHHEHVEATRHNKATEAAQRAAQLEVNRHNLVTEGQAQQNININAAAQQETARANRAREGLQAQSNAISLAVLGETAKHNRASEQIASYNAIETNRANKESEYLRQQQIDESKRSNLANEEYNALRNIIYARTSDISYSTLFWNQQQDLFMRKIRSAETLFKGVDSASNSISKLVGPANSLMTLTGK